MIEAIKLNFRALYVVLKMARLTEGPLSYRISKVKKYYPFYIHHVSLQKSKLKENLGHINQQRQSEAYEYKIKSFYEKYSQKVKNQVDQKANMLKQKEKSQYERQAQNLLHSGMRYLSLYYQSLQNLIEGRRQVLHDQSFKFEDGQTVDQKRIAFEKYLSRLLGRKKQEIDRLEEEYERKRQKQKQGLNQTNN